MPGCKTNHQVMKKLLQGQDLNLRSLGYEPSELPTTPPCLISLHQLPGAGRLASRIALFVLLSPH